MNKKGMNDLITVVILIGVVVITGIVIFTSGLEIQKSQIDNQETDVEKLGLLDFKIYYEDSNCNVVGENCYRLLVVNNENFEIGIIVKTFTDLGVDVSGPEGYVLKPFDQKVFVISYPSELRKENIYAEVNALKI